ncbi:MAG: TfoX/Sxy family protein [Pseudomonadota bacterium]|nr:TfoX/Sxy family protein [Pseudomonadota bacterium]
MSVSQEYQEYVTEQLSAVGYIVAKNMFGGVGLYADGIFFALLADDVFYMKVDDTNRQDFEQAGMDAFRPYPDKTRSMQYFEVPVEVLEDADELYIWARKSIAVALNMKKKKQPD